MSTGLWPSFLGRDGDGDIAEAIVVRLGVPRAEPEAGLGCSVSVWEKTSGSRRKGMGWGETGRS